MRLFRCTEDGNKQGEYLTLRLTPSLMMCLESAKHPNFPARPQEVALNRSQLVDEIASTTGLTRRQAEQAVDAFVGTIGDQVRSGTKVTIYGFGSFNPTSRKARTGRNPRTGQPVKIAASKGIRFSPATGFKADLNLKKAAARKAAPAKAVAAKATHRRRATASRATAVKTARRQGACGQGQRHVPPAGPHRAGGQGDQGRQGRSRQGKWPQGRSCRQSHRSPARRPA